MQPCEHSCLTPRQHQTCRQSFHQVCGKAETKMHYSAAAMLFTCGLSAASHSNLPVTQKEHAWFLSRCSNRFRQAASH